ncbi:hypothetical protein RFI_06778 [Reticulomyxa filosa]|uniref:ELMO domain-containing protein n=1 Tax=Reticulomyxa filosa TaxID=46433 RepID=X6NWI9_RETFI|nr:hypothetical protein RFI_06778 [Reticulomyxa filosa]|eukprot:ETO30341.1 hypothetical protein RFI_06778 [Reticulomyxa filosa]
MLYFGQHYPDHCHVIFAKEKSEDNYYPVCTSFINLVNLLCELTNASKESKPFEELFCVLARTFDNAWRFTKCSYMEFRFLYNAFRDRIEFLIQKEPLSLSLLIEWIETDPYIFEYKVADINKLDLINSNSSFLVMILTILIIALLSPSFICSHARRKRQFFSPSPIVITKIQIFKILVFFPDVPFFFVRGFGVVFVQLTLRPTPHFKKKYYNISDLLNQGNSKLHTNFSIQKRKHIKRTKKDITIFPFQTRLIFLKNKDCSVICCISKKQKFRTKMPTRDI